MGEIVAQQDIQHGRSPKAGGVATPPRSLAAPASPGAVGSTVKERPQGKSRDNAVVLQLTRTKMCAFFERGKCASSNCRYAHTAEELRIAPNLQKTKLCRSFMQGFCAEGENCGYAHGEQDLRVTEGIYKTQICNFYERGFCKKGDRCNHAHGVADLRPPAVAATASTPQSHRRKAAGAPGSAEAQRQSRSPLPLAELLVDAEGNTKSVTELASLAFSPVPSSPLWGRFGAAPLSPAAALAGAAVELTPPWPKDPLDVLLEHRNGRRAVTPPPPPPLWSPTTAVPPVPDPVAVDLTQRLASLDMVVRELAADVKCLYGSNFSKQHLYSI